MFDFDNIEQFDMITIPDNGVDEKGITYQVIKKEIGAFGGLVSFLQLRKISKAGGFEKAELVYNTAGEASIVYGDLRRTYTSVESCSGSRAGGLGLFNIKIGRFISK